MEIITQVAIHKTICRGNTEADLRLDLVVKKIILMGG